MIHPTTTDGNRACYSCARATEQRERLAASEQMARPEWAQQLVNERNPLVRRISRCIENGTVTATGLVYALREHHNITHVREALLVMGLEPKKISDHRLQALLHEGERSIGYLCEKLEATPIRLWQLFHQRPRYADPNEQIEPLQYSDLIPWCECEKLERAIFKGKTLHQIGEEVYDGSTREFARLQIRARNLTQLLRQRQDLRREFRAVSAVDLSSEDVARS
jgi:hypothetical protein